MSETHSDEHHSSSHHHHHHKIKIPKNILIIAAAIFVFVGLFALMIRYYDQQDVEQQPQLLLEINTTMPKIAVQTSVPQPQQAQETNISTFYDQTINWCALGDSITYGVYSQADPDGKISSSANNRESIGWTYLVANKNNWRLTNLSSSNEGYLNPANDEAGTPGYLQARTTDFKPYNLVTISLGINDWINDCPMGSMRAMIEAITASNPMCKIIVLLPLNVKGYDQSFGTQDTNWAMEYAMENSGTLKQFTQTMIHICEYYGIEYINLSSSSCINRNNLPEMLPDGIHPSTEAHNLLAHELAAKISFK